MVKTCDMLMCFMDSGSESERERDLWTVCFEKQEKKTCKNKLPKSSLHALLLPSAFRLLPSNDKSLCLSRGCESPYTGLHESKSMLYECVYLTTKTKFAYVCTHFISFLYLAHVGLGHILFLY